MNETRPRWVHTEFETEHQGIRIKVLKDGKVILSNEPSVEDFDEITVPASVIFKTVKALTLTRKADYSG